MSREFRTKYQAEFPKIAGITIGLIVGTVLCYFFAPPFGGKSFDAIGSGLLNVRVIFVILMVLPLNFIAISLLLMVFLFIKNQTRYFAFPTDIFLHKLMVLTIVVSVLEALMAGWGFKNGMYVEVNPISNIYNWAIGTFPSDLMFVGNFLLFMTILFLPIFIFAMTQLDYDYLLSIIVGYVAAFLTSVISFIYMIVLDAEGLKKFNLPREGQPIFNFTHIAVWVAAYIVYFLFIRWYDREHTLAEKTGAAIHLPAIKRKAFLGFVWRPGRKSKRGSMAALFGALGLIIVLVGLLVWGGFL